jgi:glycosyltransferase involved in cell wall biosynthesis
VSTWSIVVPTFRRPDSLRATLVALVGLDYPKDRYEVIVIDDDADGRTAELVDAQRGHGVELSFAAQSHRGAAGARNHGAQLADGDVLLFCDDDIVVQPDHLRAHLAARAARTDALVNGTWEFTAAVHEALALTPFGRYRLELERRFRDEATGRMLEDGCVEMTTIGSWDLSLRRELFWDLGGFDDRFPVAGAEDQDLSLRARAAGALLLLDPGIHCLHNDNRLDLKAYCAREERSAQTMPALFRKFPAQLGESAYVRENRPIRRGDPWRLAIKKCLKWVLSRHLVLNGLHRATGTAERLELPEPLLRRLYSGVLGLHLFRGFRRAWQQ